MKTATVHSACECQARLGAELDEHRHVIRGWARDRRRGKVQNAPAHSIRSDEAVFEVAWSCPFCIRNQLRLFETGGLAFEESNAAPASPV